MTYRGTVRSGAIVLEGPVELPEGATVEVIVGRADPAERSRRRVAGVIRRLDD